MSALKVVTNSAAPTSESLSPARENLAEAIEQLAEAAAALVRAQEPVQRLQAPVNDLARLDRQLLELDEQLSAEVGEWIGGGSIGERPQPPAAATGIRQRRDALVADAEAAALALPAALTRHSAAAETVRQAGQRRDEVLCVAAAEAAIELAPSLSDAVRQALTIEARMRGLAAALQTASDTGQLRLGGSAAGRIIEAVTAAKREPAVAQDNEGGKRLLDQLAHDPGARL